MYIYIHIHIILKIMLPVESIWVMWNTALHAEVQWDAVHKCWCYCRNSRSFAVEHSLNPPNSGSSLWRFGNLNDLVGWGKEGTNNDHGLFCGSKASKKIAECFIMICLNCIESGRTWSKKLYSNQLRVLPLACKSNRNTFGLCDIFWPICIFIYIYTHIRFPSLSL